MAYAYDIFLSYSEKDNEILPGYDSGWVDTFKKFLTTLIGQLLQHEPKIITNHEVADQKFNPLEQACVVIYLVSESYVVSDIFSREAQLLGLISNQKSMLRIDGKLRMFKVSKSYVAPESFPPFMKELVSYDLFMYDPFTGVMKEFDIFFGQDAEKTYWMRLVDLAYDIYNVINYNHKGRLDQKQKVTSTLPDECVYLAETGNDLLIQKNIIRRELERHGYRVLPDNHLTGTEADTIDIINEDLYKCKLSIHLIGKYFVDENFADREDVQLMKLQNQLAAMHSMNKKEDQPFKRLLWLPDNMSFTDEAQHAMMNTLISNTEFIYGADILKNPIEEFKSLIKRELSSMREFDSPSYIVAEPELTANVGKNVYLIVDAMDVAKSQSIVNYLKRNGYDVLLPLFEGDIMEVRAVHRANVEASDACLIFSDAVSEQWIKSKVLDIVKAPGLGKIKKKILKGIFISADKAIPEPYFSQYQFFVLNVHAESFNPDQLQNFLNKISI
jgi:hypothetical protein